MPGVSALGTGQAAQLPQTPASGALVQDRKQDGPCCPTEPPHSLSRTARSAPPAHSPHTHASSSQLPRHVCWHGTASFSQVSNFCLPGFPEHRLRGQDACLEWKRTLALGGLTLPPQLALHLGEAGLTLKSRTAEHGNGQKALFELDSYKVTQQAQFCVLGWSTTIFFFLFKKKNVFSRFKSI